MEWRESGRVFDVILYAHKIGGSFSTHLPLTFFNCFFSVPRKVLLVTSSCPIPYEGYGVGKWCLIQKDLEKAFIVLAFELLSLSNIMV